MKVIADICVIPLTGTSLSGFIARVEEIFAARGLKTILHAYGTNVEGEYDAVFSALKEAHEAIHQMGAPRISTTIRLGTRIDREQTMEDKIRSVQEKLA
ncbi:MAG: MTH1187 family thiamine-binding protein [Myxococcales bacterium]|nr:MTH1187 family thiamine-binding protein [Myxococcales bacterium]